MAAPNIPFCGCRCLKLIVQPAPLVLARCLIFLINTVAFRCLHISDIHSRYYKLQKEVCFGAAPVILVFSEM